MVAELITALHTTVSEIMDVFKKIQNCYIFQLAGSFKETFYRSCVLFHDYLVALKYR
jgi:hypothetical protein